VRENNLKWAERRLPNALVAAPAEATQRGKPDGWLGPDEASLRHRWLAVGGRAR
jgi:hypothetical protein